MKYTFGTGREAADRLIREHLPASVHLALHLGCGPGFTTDMLSRAAGAAETVGLDESEDLLALARERFPHCRFTRHDVTQIPFPDRADVIYVRFVLSHLPNPIDLFRGWLTQVNAGGILAIEETEAVETEAPVSKTYLSTNEELVALTGRPNIRVYT